MIMTQKAQSGIWLLGTWCFWVKDDIVCLMFQAQERAGMIGEDVESDEEVLNETTRKYKCRKL